MAIVTNSTSIGKIICNPLHFKIRFDGGKVFGWQPRSIMHMNRRLNFSSISSSGSIEQELYAVERWSQSFSHAFPDAEATRGHVHWHLPMNQGVAGSLTNRSEIQRRCAQALIDGAAHVSAARPLAKAHMRVAALICQPDMFMSQICLFSDPAYFRSFTHRTHPRQRWTPLPPDRRLSRELGLMVPCGFSEFGYQEIMHEPDETDASKLVVTYDGEIWMIADADPGEC